MSCKEIMQILSSSVVSKLMLQLINLSFVCSLEVQIYFFFLLVGGLVPELQLFVYVVVTKEFTNNLFSLNQPFLSGKEAYIDLNCTWTHSWQTK